MVDRGSIEDTSEARNSRDDFATAPQIGEKFSLVNSSRAIIGRLPVLPWTNYIFSNVDMRRENGVTLTSCERGSAKVHNCRCATRQVAFYRFIIENRATFLLTVRACTFPVGKKKKLDSMHLACNLCVHPSNGWNVEYFVFRIFLLFFLDIFGAL